MCARTDIIMNAETNFGMSMYVCIIMHLHGKLVIIITMTNIYMYKESEREKMFKKD